MTPVRSARLRHDNAGDALKCFVLRFLAKDGNVYVSKFTNQAAALFS